jgi:beta-lactamase class A
MDQHPLARGKALLIRGCGRDRAAAPDIPGSAAERQPRRELADLSRRWGALAAAQKGLTASGFLLVLDDGRYAELQPDRALPAASSIKTPILLASLEDLEAGKLRWNEDVVQGLGKAPEAFIGLLQGRNFGKLVVALD